MTINPDDEELNSSEPIPKEVKETSSTVNDKDLKEFVSDMPKVVEDAVEASKAKENEVNQIQETTKDFKGRPFNKDLHKTDKDGKPELTPKGRFKRKLNIPSSQGANSSGGSGVPAVDPLMVEASQYADFFIMTYRGFAGDEANPEAGERESLIAGWYAFFQKYGSIPMNPIVGVLIFHTAYIGRRAARPKTNAILKKAGEGIKGFFKGIWDRINGGKKQ
jgi:hypothetical protein